MEFGDSVQFDTWVCFPKIFYPTKWKLPVRKHKKNEFEFGQVPYNNQLKYYVKINGQTEFSEIIHKDWLRKLAAWYTHLTYQAILKPIVAQSYKRVRIFTSVKEDFLTDGKIRNLRLEKIGDFNRGFYGFNHFIDF